MESYLDEKIKSKEITANKVYILDDTKLHGYAAYDYETDCFYVRENLSDRSYLTDITNDPYFVANSLDEIIKHEMNHKKHWDSIKAHAKKNSIKDLNNAKKYFRRGVTQICRRTNEYRPFIYF